MRRRSAGWTCPCGCHRGDDAAVSRRGGRAALRVCCAGVCACVRACVRPAKSIALPTCKSTTIFFVGGRLCAVASSPPLHGPHPRPLPVHARDEVRTRCALLRGRVSAAQRWVRAAAALFAFFFVLFGNASHHAVSRIVSHLCSCWEHTHRMLCCSLRLGADASCQVDVGAARAAHCSNRTQILCARAQ